MNVYYLVCVFPPRQLERSHTKALKKLATFFCRFVVPTLLLWWAGSLLFSHTPFLIVIVLFFFFFYIIPMLLDYLLSWFTVWHFWFIIVPYSVLMLCSIFPICQLNKNVLYFMRDAKCIVIYLYLFFLKNCNSLLLFRFQCDISILIYIICCNIVICLHLHY